jgi:hypothetical protein
MMVDGEQGQSYTRALLCKCKRQPRLQVKVDNRVDPAIWAMMIKCNVDCGLATKKVRGPRDKATVEVIEEWNRIVSEL